MNKNTTKILPGLSCIMILSFLCLSADCHDGTKCNICTQLSALPSALQASQASSIDRVTNNGRSVAGSTTAHDRKNLKRQYA